MNGRINDRMDGSDGYKRMDEWIHGWMGENSDDG